jgi:hypothetical protein
MTAGTHKKTYRKGVNSLNAIKILANPFNAIKILAIPSLPLKFYFNPLNAISVRFGALHRENTV